MHRYIKRNLESKILTNLQHFPAVAILGPRQSGKSTLALNLKSMFSNFVYLDLESNIDLRKLDDPEYFFEINKSNLVCLDEIQRRPDLFPVLRSILDRTKKKGQVIILGSASPYLIQQSSETLAGRISYLELTPFLLSEIIQDAKDKSNKMNILWFRGGFPESYLAVNDEICSEWLQNFIRTYLERDIPLLGFNIPALRLERFWKMLAHSQGSMLNKSKIGASLGVTHNTISSYIDILQQNFLIRTLMPYEVNLKKRIVKSPKVYIRDSGIYHSLLEIDEFNALLGHINFGASWEGFALNNILSELPKWRGYFYRTSNGTEIDLILVKGERRIAVEFKATTAPELNKGFWNTIEDLGIKEVWIIALVKESYQIRKNVTISSLEGFIKYIKDQ